MTFEEKCRFAVQELENAKIRKLNYNPPVLKLLHKLGFEVPYPHYNSFIHNAFSTGVYFSVFWGLIMYFINWKDQNISILVICLTSLFAGMLFGLAMAFYYKYSFKKYNLTAWHKMKNA